MSKIFSAIGIAILIVLALGVLAIGYFMAKNDIALSGIVPLIRPGPSLPPAGEALPFQLPRGFTARLYASDTPDARVMTRDPRGTLLVSLTSEGSVVALPDENGDGVADASIEVIEGLDKPHGLSFICDPIDPEQCTLYIAEKTAVYTYDYDAKARKAMRGAKLVDLPGGSGHSTRTLLPHPDGEHLLVSVGSSCNVCEEDDPRRAAILSIDVRTGSSTSFATGLRNTVFMAIHPVTGDIWGTEMGRDLLGDDIPPDEINILREGGWYGWPWYYGDNTFDKTFRPGETPLVKRDPIASHVNLQAHSAPLGLAFVPEEGWPEAYWHDLIVAYHGSWNRSVPTGYKLVRIDLDDNGAYLGTIEDFMTGFLKDGSVLGRPTGLLIEPGGVLFVADDSAGAIYRITRE